MITEGLFSSETDMWATPQYFFDVLNEVFNFKLDVCAIAENAKCEKYFTPEQDGLKQDWKESSVWMNPPYGNPENPCKEGCKKKGCKKRGYHIDEYVPGITDWMQKASEESRKWRNTIVCLIPARTDTKYMHKYVFSHAKYICFIKGRLKFGDGEGAAPFPSMVVIYTDKDYSSLIKTIDVDGRWVTLY